MSESSLLYSDVTEQIIGSAMTVHSTLGAGFLESVYEEALAVEFEMRKINIQDRHGLTYFTKAEPLSSLL